MIRKCFLVNRSQSFYLTFRLSSFARWLFATVSTKYVYHSFPHRPCIWLDSQYHSIHTAHNQNLENRKWNCHPVRLVDWWWLRIIPHKNHLHLTKPIQFRPGLLKWNQHISLRLNLIPKWMACQSPNQRCHQQRNVTTWIQHRQQRQNLLQSLGRVWQICFMKLWWTVAEHGRCRNKW